MSDFQKIPGVGKSLEQDFLDLGFTQIADLKNQNPEDLYLRFSALRGEKICRCVLYVFRGAVAYANQPHDKQWWEFKD